MDATYSYCDLFGKAGATLSRRVPFFHHGVGIPELKRIEEVLSGPILTTGKTVKLFESQFASYLGVNHALGVTSCTGAMHISLLAMDIGPGDEVITTPMTFIATATAIIEAGATPVFVDVEPDTGNIDSKKIEAAITDKTKAILPVHLYGQMCDMKSIRAIADKHKLKIIEDAAHCVEGSRGGIKPGQMSDTACFSFYATKSLTCGEGGAVVTNDAKLAEKLRLLRLHGMSKTAADRHREGYSHWDMVAMGWKYNMDNIQAAMLLPQLERIKQTSKRREYLTLKYETLLNEIDGVKYPICIEDSIHARHLFTIWVDSAIRDNVIASLKGDGVEAMVNYRAIHLLSYFKETLNCKKGGFPIAEKIGSETISLPFYPSMPEEDIDTVSASVKSALNKCSVGLS